MAIAVARMEDALPLVGASFVGGAIQSYAVRKYPQWSVWLSAGLMGLGVYGATKGGTVGTMGLGLAAAASAGLGMALMPIGAGASGQSMSARMLGTSRQLSAGVGSYPSPMRQSEFQGVRLG